MVSKYICGFLIKDLCTTIMACLRWMLAISSWTVSMLDSISFVVGSDYENYGTKLSVNDTANDNRNTRVTGSFFNPFYICPVSFQTFWYRFTFYCCWPNCPCIWSTNNVSSSFSFLFNIFSCFDWHRKHKCALHVFAFYYSPIWGPHKAQKITIHTILCRQYLCVYWNNLFRFHLFLLPLPFPPPPPHRDSHEIYMKDVSILLGFSSFHSFHFRFGCFDSSSLLPFGLFRWCDTKK